jgi:hypothetical protein
MEIDFSQNCSFMVWAMLKNPNQLSAQQGAGINPYKAPDQPGGLQVVALQEFVDKKLTEKPTDTTLKFKAWTGKLKQGYVVRLKEIAKHFEHVGMQTQNCNAYLDLLYALEGKKLSTDVESAEE